MASGLYVLIFDAVYGSCRGGWIGFKCYYNTLLVIAFFCLLFDMTLNSCNAKTEK